MRITEMGVADTETLGHTLKIYIKRYEPAYLLEHCRKENSWKSGCLLGCSHEKDAREIDEFEDPIRD